WRGDICFSSSIPELAARQPSIGSIRRCRVNPQAGQKAATPAHTLAADRDKALIAITFDLEMSIHYPTWDQMEWNFRKGDLDTAAKKYTIDAARLVKERGGRMHDFLVARVLEQQDVDWLKEMIRDGHHL